MTKTLSVGVINDSKINYLTFKFHTDSEVDYFCNDLAEYIIDKYNSLFLKLIINKNYGYFDKIDRREIYKIVKKTFSNTYSKEVYKYQAYIKTQLYNYFEEEQADKIDLDGFARFRLGEYCKELEILVDYAVEEYFIKLEYESFIEMLKEFVALQTPISKLVHICSEFDGRYFIYDENFEELTKSHILDVLGILAEDVGELINDDDFLLSALISIAPRKIVIHNKENLKNKQLMDTIKKVFVGRIMICSGCDICNKNRIK